MQPSGDSLDGSSLFQKPPPEELGRQLCHAAALGQGGFRGSPFRKTWRAARDWPGAIDDPRPEIQTPEDARFSTLCLAIDATRWEGLSHCCGLSLGIDHQTSSPDKSIPYLVVVVLARGCS